jgi:adenylate cyclase
VAGQSYDSVFGTSLSERLLGLYLRSVRSGQATKPHLLRATLPGGRAVELKASMGPIRDDEGAMIGLLFVADEAAQAALAQAETDATLVRLRTALRRYVGEGVASMVEERPSFIGVGGIRRHVSVLHADVRGYTTVAEALEPEDTVRLLLRYHGQVVNALLAQGATLDRFIGDSVLAFWNAPDSCEQHARSALIGALAVQRAAGQVGTELGYGIGVHTGDAVVGNLGNENFYNYAAVGDTVNVAARLQSQAGPGEIVCSEQVLSEAGEGIRVSALGSVTVKGRKNPVTMYRVEGVESQEEL